MAITIFINGIGHESGAVFGDPPAGRSSSGDGFYKPCLVKKCNIDLVGG
jgi:hypothetical protein